MVSFIKMHNTEGRFFEGVGGGSVFLYLDISLSCLLVIHVETLCGNLHVAVCRSGVVQS